MAEVEDAAEEVPLPSAADVDVRWVHRATSAQAPGVELVAVVAAATTPLPEDGLDAFVHGEAGFVRDVRRHLRAQGLPLARLSASGYWRRGRTDEVWRAEKSDWKRVVEDDDAALAAAARPDAARAAGPGPGRLRGGAGRSSSIVGKGPGRAISGPFSDN